MKYILITDWERGFKKVSLTKLLHEKANYSLSEAKRATDMVLNHQPLTVECKLEMLDNFIRELKEVGVKFTEVRNESGTKGE